MIEFFCDMILCKNYLDLGKTMSGYIIRHHSIKVPLDYQHPNGKKISVYGKEILLDNLKNNEVLVFLQGGPGYESERDYKNQGWLQYALQYYRVFLVDSRGTGNSTAIDVMEQKKNKQFLQYLTYFRADSIVCDCEEFRKRIFKGKAWYLLGQSYGGFTAISYLSHYPRALKGVMIAGGLPPPPYYAAKQIYQKLLNHTEMINKLFYQNYATPKLKDDIIRICNILHKAPYPMPDGGFFSVRRFLNIGFLFGGENGFYELEKLLDSPFTDATRSLLSWRFVKSACDLLSYQEHPIYALLHESIYCHNAKSNWASEQIMQSIGHFDGETKTPYFHAENIRKNVYADYALLQPYKKVADKIAQKTWGALYNIDQLKKNNIPVVAVVYKKDFFVNYDLSLETANFITNCHAWRNQKDVHGALRYNGRRIFKGLHTRLIKQMKA